MYPNPILVIGGSLGGNTGGSGGGGVLDVDITVLGSTILIVFPGYLSTNFFNYSFLLLEAFLIASSPSFSN
jgi:hypothetical protein